MIWKNIWMLHNMTKVNTIYSLIIVLVGVIIISGEQRGW
ncbi:hypothetical protein D1AOALGA4SA_5179 [Olavius algarvensis Delta 1 endosymbiont]|nr:hypothetical protein D1AOALGA4SA_5179 [Olavius algarvensis Delta 1 endosymbiont]